jgi:hypothetical protein
LSSWFEMGRDEEREEREGIWDGTTREEMENFLEEVVYDMT